MQDDRPLVVTVISGMTPGGAQQLVVDFHSVFPPEFRGEVIGLYPGPLAERLRRVGVPIREFPFRGPLMLAAIPFVWWELRKRRPHGVITHLGFANAVGRCAARLACVPRVISVYHSLDRWRRNPLWNWLDRVTSHLADHLLAVSQSVADFLKTNGLDERKVRVCHARGELAERFPSIELTSEKSAALRSELRVPQGAIVSLMAGRLVPAKAYDVALAAWAKVHGRVPGSLLLIAGDGPLLESLREQARTLRCEDSIRFLGQRSDVAVLLRFADLFVLASRLEGFPIALQEAFAAGLPAVVSDQPGIQEVVAITGGALTVPREDQEALAVAWERLVVDEELRIRLGEEARTKALAQLDVRSMRDDYLRLLGLLPPA